MVQNLLFSILIVIISGIFSLIWGQDAVKPVVIVGDVVTTADKKFVVNAKSGQVEVTLAEKTAYKRVSAENPALTAATAGTLAEIGVGDRLTISALPSADGKTLTARSVYYMTKADIAAKNAKDAEKWRTRGITGKVTSVNATTNQIIVETRTLMGSANVTLTPKESAKFLRYAPDSIRFDEAIPSTLAEVKTGDMLRALGDKSTDGTSFSAEQVIAGAFQTIAGTVKSVDAEKKEIVITNLQTKKEMTVVIGDASVVKKFPVEQAEQLARFQGGAGGAAPGGARPVGGGTPPEGARQGPPQGGGQTAGGPPAGGGQGRQGFGGRMGGGGVDDMLDRLPNITAADLKAGDMVAISSAKNGTNDRIKAIKLLAGVEPFLRLAQAGGQGGRGRGGQGGADNSFSIPGLDGIGFP